MVRDVRDEQSEKAHSPMNATEVGITMVEREEKVYSPIQAIEEGM